MNLKSKIVLALLATSSAAFAQTAPVAPEVTYNVGVVSEYRQWFLFGRLGFDHQVDQRCFASIWLTFSQRRC
jgi:hypothetical protein